MFKFLRRKLDVPKLPEPRQQLCADLAVKLAIDITRAINRTLKVAEAGEATGLESTLIVLGAAARVVSLMELELDLTEAPFDKLLESARKYSREKS